MTTTTDPSTTETGTVAPFNTEDLDPNKIYVVLNTDVSEYASYSERILDFTGIELVYTDLTTTGYNIVVHTGYNMHSDTHSDFLESTHESTGATVQDQSMDMKVVYGSGGIMPVAGNLLFTLTPVSQSGPLYIRLYMNTDYPADFIVYYNNEEFRILHESSHIGMLVFFH